MAGGAGFVARIEMGRRIRRASWNVHNHYSERGPRALRVGGERCNSAMCASGAWRFLLETHSGASRGRSLSDSPSGEHAI